MTEAQVYDLCCEIYATFGKKEPARSSSIVEALAARVQDIPDSAGRYIFERIADLPSMPANLGKAFREGFEGYLRANPQVAASRDRCVLCNGNGGWEAWQPAGDGETWHHFFAFCPKCGPKRDDRTYQHPRLLQQRGMLVMPSGYRGGRVQFEKDNGLGPLGDSPLARKCRSMAEARAAAGVRRVSKGYSE